MVDSQHVALCRTPGKCSVNVYLYHHPFQPSSTCSLSLSSFQKHLPAEDGSGLVLCTGNKEGSKPMCRYAGAEDLTLTRTQTPPTKVQDPSAEKLYSHSPSEPLFPHLQRKMIIPRPHASSKGFLNSEAPRDAPVMIIIKLVKTCGTQSQKYT